MYIVTFIDDFTRYCWAYPMADKTMVHIALGNMLENARTILGREANITFLRLDNGTEYLTESMKLLIKKEKIVFKESPPYTPNLNGTAERFNLDIQQKIRSLLFDSGFPLQMWGYALNFAVNIYNKTPKRALGYKIPFEMLHKRSCTIKYFRRFGCLSYVLNPQIKGKFTDRSMRGFLVACGETSYYVVVPETGKVYRSKNVKFIESKTYGNIY
ncbi:GAG-pre-integrase domain [Popillia japonica]